MTRLTLRLLEAMALIVIWLALGACSSEGCTNNRNSIPMAGFYDSATGDAVTVSGLSVGGVDAPNDSLVLKPENNAHQVWLPFRGNKSETAYYFTSGEVADVVTFTYDSYPYFEGEDCGAMWRYVITDVTHTGLLIDSIRVTDPLITNIERERIMIFITTATDDEDETE